MRCMADDTQNERHVPHRRTVLFTNTTLQNWRVDYCCPRLWACGLKLMNHCGCSCYANGFAYAQWSPSRQLHRIALDSFDSSLAHLPVEEIWCWKPGHVQHQNGVFLCYYMAAEFAVVVGHQVFEKRGYDNC